MFGEELEKRLGNQVLFEFHENVVNQGNTVQGLPKMVEDDQLSMCYLAASYLTQAVPEFALLDLPFTYTDRSATYAVLDGPFGNFLADRLTASTGIKLLHFWDNGFRHFSNNLRPIVSPSDCAGMTIRTLFSDHHGRVFRALGFDPVPLDVKDLVDAVRSGRVIAQENPLTNTYNFGLHKFHRYITLTSHFFGAAVMLCNQKFYDSLHDDVRLEFDRAAAAASARQRQFAANEDQLILQKLSDCDVEVLSLTPEQRAVFRDAAEPVVQDLKVEFGDDLFAMIQKS